MKLYHYYDSAIGAFKNLSDLPSEEARRVMDELRQQKSMFASKRADGYLERRFELENIARGLFIEKGGKPERAAPHYMVVEKCGWLESWYNTPCFIEMDISLFDTDKLSFCYGDLFPTFSPRVADGREYRGQVYTYNEILVLINKYGLPQDWNPDGSHGPERYVEVHVWDDNPIKNYIKNNRSY
ncbi:MAG: hypothetical protein AB9835_07765 [Eubacteriales bacterium]